MQRNYCNKRLVWLFAAAAIALTTLSELEAAAGPVDGWPSKPAYYVTDNAGMIDAQTRQTLNGYLQELEQKTGAQFVVVTVDTLGSETKESFALAIAEKWKIGRKGKDDGLVFLLAKADRKYRIEVGYGLEGLLPDGLTGQLARELLVPQMRKGNSSKGIADVVIAITEIIAKDKNVTITGMPKSNRRHSRGGGGFDDWGLLVVVLGIILFSIFASAGSGIRGGRGGRGGWRGGGPFIGGFGGGGGRSGGGFGGFGGGGGGSFGGGGAGGSW